MDRIQIDETFLRQFPRTGRYLVGVSGGRDSVALLHLLAGAGYRRLIVCHLNHQLRGRSSDADARFVNDLVERYRRGIAGQGRRLPGSTAGKRSAGPAIEIESVAASIDVRVFAAKNKMSIETAARACRYNFFARVAKQKRCRTVFLAHHADDLVETFLLNLFRGAGLTGLAAMRDITKRHVSKIELTIVRPLLGVWRSEIDAYVRRADLKFRHDASNESLDPLRNRLRHRVLPYLEKTTGRSLRRNLWRTAMIAAEEENFWETLLPKQLDTLAVKSLREMSTALQRRTLRSWLHDARVPDIGFDLIERIRRLLDSTARVAKTNLPQDRHVRRKAGKLFIE